jgi:hypothetical protein
MTNRFTKKDRNGHFYTNEANCRNVHSLDGKKLEGEFYENQTLAIDGNAIEKLGELEDIEEEYGIDLIILLKLLSAADKGLIYVKVRKIKQYTGYSAIEETGKIERAFITRFSRYINGTRDWFFTIYSGDTSIATNYVLKDYGVNWAFSREELEKQKGESK